MMLFYNLETVTAIHAVHDMARRTLKREKRVNKLFADEAPTQVPVNLLKVILEISAEIVDALQDTPEEDAVKPFSKDLDEKAQSAAACIMLASRMSEGPRCGEKYMRLLAGVVRDLQAVQQILHSIYRKQQELKATQKLTKPDKEGRFF